MPRTVKIEVFPIASTRIDWGFAEDWLRRLGVTDVEHYLSEMRRNSTDAEALVMLAGRRCYMSFQPGLNPNVEKVRADYTDYIDNILRSGHGSVIEHPDQTFAIEGVSRVFTGEMNRHRAGWSISEGSMRYIRFEDIPFWMPDSLQFDINDDEDLDLRKRDSRDLFEKAFKQMEENYAEFMQIWRMDEAHPNFHYKKRITSAARRIIGMGVATGGLWTGNLRAVRHVLDLRCDDQAAEEEIFHVFRIIGDMMVLSERRLFGDFTMNEAGAWNAGYKKV
jgi:thymidylate synthase (FAD)